MGKMMFGSDETLTCIEKVELKGAEQEDLCLAHMHTKVFFIAGVYLKDDGYVLKIAGKDSYYPIPEGEELAAFQESGMLPQPLPAYSIGVIEYAMGYSLWIILFFVGIFTVWTSRRERIQATEDAAVPVSHGPPLFHTEADKFIREQVKPQLLSREVIQHQAYATDGEPNALTKAFFVVLTNQRIFFIKTRVGAFKLLLENNEMQSFPLDQIVDVTQTGRSILIAFENGARRTIFVNPHKKLSNQEAFRRDVSRILAARLATVAEAS